MNELSLSKPVYIPSIEACDIYNHMLRDREIKAEYIGMIPTSLELEKLISVGLNVNKKKTSDKLLSDDVINVKFTQKARSGLDLIKINSDRITALDIKESKLDEDDSSVEAEKRKEGIIEYKQKLTQFIELIRSEIEMEKWEGLKSGDLRKKLYKNGFMYNGHKYSVYKRSSAKSRVGQCLFIKDILCKKMIEWSRMYLPFDKLPDDVKVDYPSLLAYESLVGSSIENTIKIHPKNILIVSDVESKFKQTCNVVRTGKDKYLDSFTEEAEITNSLFDGESLLDASYFPEGKSMMLLRNHMFKSAAFNTNIQKYLKIECPDEICFDEWTIPNMFDQEGDGILAKDVHLITTPSSLKALKFSNVIGGESAMWNYWKQIVVDNDCMFGVCKNEKKSKHGDSQQMSYQMINSLPLDSGSMEEKMSKLSQFELEYIEKLKNDDEFFMEYIKKSANEINSNSMFVSLYEHNSDILRTKLFRKFRTKEINNHVSHVKRGKIRLNGDYLVLFGNPLEFLKHAINRLDIKNPMPTIKGNEVYTTMFNFNKDLSGFRNPHTSPSNILVAKNTYNKNIEDYFNLTKNILCVNAIEFPIQDILSSCDYDSDTVLIIDDDDLLPISKHAFGKYKVCINNVASSKKEYKISKEDMSNIDNELSKSQFLIGEVVNLGQWALSAYWDMLSKGKAEKELEELLKKVDVMTILSCICIDLAKKMFEINIRSEISNVRKVKELKNEDELGNFTTKGKPLFFEIVSQNDDIKTEKYECPMDYLYESMTGLKYANHKKDEERKNLEMKELLVINSLSKSDRKQEKKIIEYVDEMCTKINKVYLKNLKDEDRDEIIDNLMKYYEFYIKKLSVSENTMYALLLKIAQNKKDNVARKMLSILHRTQNTTFLSQFQAKNSTL